MLLDKLLERDDRRQLARGDDRIAAFKTAPERLRARRSWLCEGTALKTRACRQPHVLFATEDTISVLGPFGRRIALAPGFFIGRRQDDRTGALAEAAQLPPEAASAMAGWLSAARLRADAVAGYTELDRALAATN